MIEKNFSRAAHTYDEYADIQYMAAIDLIRETPDRKFGNILEIGCGTGNYTALLRERFKDAPIKAVDKSREMVRIAKKKLEGKQVEFIIADAERLDMDEKFGLITSNAVLQWFWDLKSAVAKYKSALAEDGVLSFSVFGPGTFWELGYSLRAAAGRDITISAANFLGKDRIDEILRAHFREIAVKERVIKETFSSLTELLNKIKCSGVRGEALHKFFLWKKDMLKKAEDIYKSRFGALEASYQIFFYRALL
jgi:malonyl-CoA O-methyltransferase